MGWGDCGRLLRQGLSLQPGWSGTHARHTSDSQSCPTLSCSSQEFLVTFALRFFFFFLRGGWFVLVCLETSSPYVPQAGLELTM